MNLPIQDNLLELLNNFLTYFFNLDVYLSEITFIYGPFAYALIFLVIFAETGFVATPFLPGDSLLFASGAIAALGGLNIYFLIGLLFAAAVLGDTVNYWIARRLGLKILNSKRIKINKKYLIETKQFFKLHGGKTIMLARFLPFIRTFAPFVAGLGEMNYSKFIIYNISGGFVWVTLFTLLGFYFGNIPAVSDNFSFVIIGIIIISLLPMLYRGFFSRRKER